MNMQGRMLHAILSGVIMAVVLGFFLIPATWRMVSEEPTFGPATNGLAIAGIITSVAIMAITLLSFRPVRRAEE
jgi:hypothetical protein